MAFSACPSCGFDILECSELNEVDHTDPALPPRQRIVLIECVSCHWIGSTSRAHVG